MTKLTDHQAKLFALELLRRHPVGETARIGSALMDAQVDLNPHQVDAALFAFRTPFSKGVILADEVGLNQFSLCCDRIGRDLELELKRAGRCLPLAPGRGESRGGLCCPRS